MKATGKRVKKAMDEVLEHIDYILEGYEGRDFVEIVGAVGGDIVRYRVYFNGDDIAYICEK